MSFFKTLKCTYFRNYTTLSLSELAGGLVVLYGANGAGKTNILEAVSFLSAGRGMRAARVMEVQSAAHTAPWAVAGVLQTRYEEVRIGTGLDPKSIEGAEKRVLHLNNEAMKSQAKLSEYLSCVWLTPQMDRLFMDSARDRRKFLDRLVFTFDSGHAGRVSRYDNALAQRSKLLREGRHDDAWLSGLERQIAETGIAIAAARLDFVTRLQAACEQAGERDGAAFPIARLRVAGFLENVLETRPALEVEESFRASLKQSRPRDAITGGAKEGAHKSDLAVIYAAKSMAADQCSTGEQKALLTGVILAHARLIKAERGTPPILLMDEVAAHLDENRRAALYRILQDLGGQVWLTGTDRNLFDAIEGKAQFFEIADGGVVAP